MIYRTQKLNLEKLKKVSNELIYRAWEQADLDISDCIGMTSELLLYDEDLHNSSEDDLKALVDIILQIQAEMDLRGLPHEKTFFEPHQPQYVKRPV